MKKIIGIFIVTLLIGTMAIPIIATDSDDTTINQIDYGHHPHQPGDPIEVYDLLGAKNVNPLYQDKQPNIQASFNNDIVELIEQIDEAMIYSYIENLTSFGIRLTTTQACIDAGNYLYDEFLNMGLDVRYQNWSYAANYYGSNIEATLEGSDSESDFIFIVGAHYDSYVGPGADDDASGVAAVLAAANIMRHYSFNHTIRFVAFSGEEQGLFGSYYYAEEAYRNGDHIIGMLNADPISYATNDINASKINLLENEESAWLTNYTTDIAQIYEDYIELEIIPFYYFEGSSDHVRFWQFGYEAVQYMSNEHNPYWHTPNDVIESCNMIYGKRVSRLILATLADLAQSYQGEPSIDIPTWEVGDEWTYHLDFYADFGTIDKEITYGTSDNLVYTVVDDTGNDYILEYQGDYSGWIKTAFASIKISKFSTAKGDLVIQKSNLAIKEYSIEISGISFLMNGNKPIPIPIPVKMGINVDLSPAFCIMPFPLYDGKYGNIPTSNLNHTGSLDLMFGLLFNLEKQWAWDAVDFPYRCDKELTTVDAGTFDTYKISVGTLSAQIENNYAPDVGNIVKQRIWVNKGYFLYEPFLEIKQELISTNYIP